MNTSQVPTEHLITDPDEAILLSQLRSLPGSRVAAEYNPKTPVQVSKVNDANVVDLKAQGPDQVSPQLARAAGREAAKAALPVPGFLDSAVKDDAEPESFQVRPAMTQNRNLTAELLSRLILLITRLPALRQPPQKQ